MNGLFPEKHNDHIPSLTFKSSSVLEANGLFFLGVFGALCEWRYLGRSELSGRYLVVKQDVQLSVCAALRFS
jgi:hypothetical protein